MAKHFQVDTGGTLTTSLISYYNMEGNSNDYYGSNNMTDTSVSYSSSGGIVGQYCLYSGTSHNQDNSPSGMPTGNPLVSVACWVYTTSLSGNNLVFSMGTFGNLSYFNNLVIDTGGHIFFALKAGDTITSTGTIGTNAWHHIAATYSSTLNHVILYIDGSVSGTGTISQTPAIAYGYIAIGGSSNDGWQMVGRIDELGVWNKVLSTTEITDLYNGGAGQTMVSTTPNTSGMFLAM